ncbi:hypothetical protein M378DRAFT_195762 [Amanita muscaria Koide BX008]|uniref:CCHC-type domain-containing protein n=1 Tax=Amanita muscaria (strain Koide BX008) TaxID=946122 RepID=A0A0C2XK20_AMAMK|nr:hypothetical protein M378DRAFT_195762 [Amanita muscaria Koide BX008]
MASLSEGRSSAKLLTTGSVAGHIHEFFNKLKSIDAKHGKFDSVLCVGDFFGSGKDDEIRQLLDGELQPPIECYIMQGETPLPEIVVQGFAKTGGELCRGLFLLSKSGVVTTTHGLRIACLGGLYDASVYSSADAPLGFLSPHFSAHTVERLLANTMSSDHSQNYKSLSAIQSSAAASPFVDILITHSWPQSITQFSAVPPPIQDLASFCAPPLDDVVRRIMPRYHFTSGGGNPPQFWEREPFNWDEHGRVSRFISLGAFGGEAINGKKPRWFYAFSIQAGTSGAKPANATKNPYSHNQLSFKRPIDNVEVSNYIFGDIQPPKRQRHDVVRMPTGTKCRRCESTDHIAFDCPSRPRPHEGYICRTCNQSGHFVRDCPTRDALGDTGGRKPREGYMCRACGSDQHYIEDCFIPNERSRHVERRSGNRQGPLKEIAPDECWFCLSNPNLAKYLIVAIGNECYITLPKGQINPTHSSPLTNVPGGGHVLIVPIAHYPTYSSIPADLASGIVEETERYKSALHAFYGKHSAVMVTFEVGRLSAKGGHAHVQAVPVPSHLKDKIEEAFVNEGRSIGVHFESDPDSALGSCSNGRGSYFKVDLPDGRKLVHLIQDHVPFSVSFGRRVLVNLLGVPDRLDWRACALSEAEDQEDAQAFKAAFTPFNPIN